MIYGVNMLELGINEVLQLIELTLGEGKYLFNDWKNFNLNLNKS